MAIRSFLHAQTPPDSGKNRLLLLVITLLAKPAPAMADTITYESYLPEPADLPLNGNADITFTLYEGHDSTIVWSEKQSGVEVKSGKFRVELGLHAPLN